MRKFKVTLEQQERDSLVAITQKGAHQSRKVLNALILLNCDQGQFQDRCLRNEDVAADSSGAKGAPLVVHALGCSKRGTPGCRVEVICHGLLGGFFVGLQTAPY